MKPSYYFAILFFSFCGISNLNSQIVINEYSASNLDQFPDDYSKFEDWFELYNASDEVVDLSGWYASDKATKPTKWEFPAGVTISPKGYLKVWCSGRDSVSDFGIHTDFKLSQTTGDEVISLANANGNLVDIVPLELTHLGHSRGRVTDGSPLWKVFISPSIEVTNNDSEGYDGYTDSPLISLAPGFYEGEQKLILDADFQGVEVYYTTDGNLPTKSSIKYIEGTEIIIHKTQVLKARAYSVDPNVLPGKIAFASYFIGEKFSLPVFSIAGNNLKELANGNGNIFPIASLEYFDINGDRKAVSYGELNRHGQDSWALPHRSIDWISRDEMAYNKAVPSPLFNYSERDEYQRLIFRASGDDNYPANGDFNHQGSCHVRDEFVHTLAKKGGMKLDVRAVERVIVFLNGEYWGVYGLREKPVDHDYTEEYYNQDKYQVHFLNTWGNTWAEYGGQAAFDDWTALRDYILNNDMSIEENYDYVKSKLQVQSLCDYMIANLNTVASDWLNYNTGWWRGTNPKGDHKKWGYILWDNDATFDYYINYSGVPNTDPDAKPCDINQISEFMDGFFGNGNFGKHEKIFLKMLDESDSFRQLYYSRQADLLNTVFSCENMLTTFDSMIAIIEPEMPRQIERWGGSYEEWSNNVTTMRDFIEARCIAIDDGMVDCYNLTGPFQIVVHVEPENAGSIDFNTLELNSFPWVGNYFGQMPNYITAKPVDETYEFLYWKTSEGNLISPDSSFANVEYWSEVEDSLTAVFGLVTSVIDLENELNTSIYPTLITDAFVLDIDLESNQNILLKIYDASGQLVDQFMRFYPEGRNKEILRLNENLITGSYFIEVSTHSKSRVFNVFVNN